MRGYITGSAWKEYTTQGTVHGIPMPPGLREGERLQKPIWTPSTKAEAGQKDENISPEKGALAHVPTHPQTPKHPQDSSHSQILLETRKLTSFRTSSSRGDGGG